MSLPGAVQAQLLDSTGKQIVAFPINPGYWVPCLDDCMRRALWEVEVYGAWEFCKFPEGWEQWETIEVWGSGEGIISFNRVTKSIEKTPGEHSIPWELNPVFKR